MGMGSAKGCAQELAASATGAGGVEAVGGGGGGRGAGGGGGVYGGGVGWRRLQRVGWADVQERLVRLMGGKRVEASDARFAMIDRAAAKIVTQETAAVLAREDGCVASFKRGKELGVPRIYVLPTAHQA